ncbi:hypothetical protein DMENIID0001_033580 [Sergentomyia squamirostris]
MTNSQNRPSNGGSRYSSGGGGQFASPPQQHHHHQHQPKVPQMGGGYGSAMATSPPNGGHMKGGMGGSARKSRNQRSPSGATYFASQSMLVFTPVKQQHKMSVTPTGQQHHMMSSSPPNLSHFAASKCYEAPAPTALPRPPDHWKLPTSASKAVTIPQKVMMPTSKTSPQTCGGVFNDGKSDIFSQNLKMLLNIKA